MDCRLPHAEFDNYNSVKSCFVEKKLYLKKSLSKKNSYFYFRLILKIKVMGKEKTVKKEEKKKATKSLKEKRDEKKAKKASKQ